MDTKNFSPALRIHPVQVGDAYHAQAVQLREAVLRKPLGRSFTADELAQDAERHHLVARAEETVLASVSYSMETPQRVRIKQMAVAETQRGTGIGARLLAAAEQAGKALGATQAKLHARRTAEAFYLRQGYRITSEEFAEQGIPHVIMEKELA